MPVIMIPAMVRAYAPRFPISCTPRSCKYCFPVPGPAEVGQIFPCKLPLITFIYCVVHWRRCGRRVIRSGSTSWSPSALHSGITFPKTRSEYDAILKVQASSGHSLFNGRPLMDSGDNERSIVLNCPACVGRPSLRDDYKV